MLHRKILRNVTSDAHIDPFLVNQRAQKLMIEVPETKEITANEDKQTEIITDFFKNIFYQENEEEIPIIEPCEMKIPFTEKEIAKAVKSLKNNKSAGCDEIKAELIKHCPSEIHKAIAELLNNVAKTGEYPTEIKKRYTSTSSQTWKNTRTTKKSPACNPPINTTKNPSYMHDQENNLKTKRKNTNNSSCLPRRTQYN